MGQKLKPHQVVRILKAKKLNIFTPLEFQRVFGVSRHASQWFIKSHAKDEIFIKLRNGLYMLADYPAPHYVIANLLYAPSYISFDTALSFHGLIPETIYTVTSATTKGTREFTVQNVLFKYHKLKKKIYTGYKPIKYLDTTILMAEPEKALADYLYFVALEQRGLHYERLDLGKIKKEKLMQHVRLFERPQMKGLVEKIYDEFRKPKRVY